MRYLITINNSHNTTCPALAQSARLSRSYQPSSPPSQSALHSRVDKSTKPTC